MHVVFIVCGYISSFLAILAQLPQLITIIKHKSGKNLSYPYLCLIMIDCILYIVYGSGFLFYNNFDGIPIILSGFIPFLITFIILILKVFFTILKKKEKSDNTINNNNNTNNINNTIVNLDSDKSDQDNIDNNIENNDINQNNDDILNIQINNANNM